MSRTKRQPKGIVRTPNFAGGGITPEEKVRMDAHAAEWIAIARKTGPTDHKALTDAILGIYAAAKLPAPRVVIVPSPRIMAFAGGFAAAIWYLRCKKARSATFSATDLATESATESATDWATHSATYLATHSATASATDWATASATDWATYLATHSATDLATFSATASATDWATDWATHSATDLATFSATASATDLATESATRSATDWATDWATHSATDLATRSATASATDWATESATESIFVQLSKEILGQYYELGLSCAKNWSNMYQGGNMWAAWESYLTAARDILGLRLEPHAVYAHWEAAARNGGFRIMHEKFCMVSELPVELHCDEQGRAHCSTGPSHLWGDGWALYYWHGVKVPDFVIVHPEQITIRHIAEETNAEVRRVMIERYGESRYIVDSGMRPIAHDEVFGTLYVQNFDTGRPVAKIQVVNRSPEPDGTFKHYWLDVNPAHYGGDAGRVPQAAVASTWRTTPGGRELLYKDYRDYRPAVET